MPSSHLENLELFLRAVPGSSARRACGRISCCFHVKVRTSLRSSRLKSEHFCKQLAVFMAVWRLRCLFFRRFKPFFALLFGVPFFVALDGEQLLDIEGSCTMNLDSVWCGQTHRSLQPVSETTTRRKERRKKEEGRRKKEKQQQPKHTIYELDLPSNGCGMETILVVFADVLGSLFGPSVW